MKLIASDLDGTLLNDEGRISAENVQAIQKAMDLGIKFVVATGRSYDAARMPLQAVNITCPIISLNGAVTYGADQTVMNRIEMDGEVSKKILKVCQKYNLDIEFYTSNGMYSEDRYGFVDVLEEINNSASIT